MVRGLDGDGDGDGWMGGEERGEGGKGGEGSISLAKFVSGGAEFVGLYLEIYLSAIPSSHPPPHQRR